MGDLSSGKIKYLGAADIGGTSIKLGLFDQNGRLCRNWSIPTDISDSGSHILPELCDSLKAAAGASELAGIGIAVPGAVDEQGIARNGTNIGWGIVDLNAEIKKLLPEAGLRRFGNDATVAALGELRYGSGRKHASAYFITLGTGVGGGYAAGGTVTNGAHGAAGEIGHILINPHETAKCMCGRCGCLEQYASANGIVRLARNILRLKAAEPAENRPELLKPAPSSPWYEIHIEGLLESEIPDEKSRLEELDDFSSRDICELASQGDKLCMYIVKIFGSCMGLAMSHISCSVDPEVYIIGGGMSEAGDIIIDAVREGFARYVYSASSNTRIIRAQLGNLAGLYGCAAMLTQK